MTTGAVPNDPIRRRMQDVRLDATTLSMKAADTSLSSGTGSPGALRELKIPNPFGRYRILKELGSGAMGVVYLAEDMQLGRPVALKIPRAAALLEPESLERFYREARTIAALRHHNVCQVYDVGELGGIHFLSMEFVEGKTLSSYINAAKPPPPKTIAHLFRKIAIALQEAHAKDVVHRDLKPSNVMLDARKEPKVMDFGLACQLNTAEQARLTQTGAILGTPAYMAPEQVRGDLTRIGPRTDIYALGVMLYEFLVGERPFAGAVLEVCAKVLTEQPLPPSQRRAGVDPTLEALCLHMMAKDPDQRLPRMRDVADVLTAYIKNGPTLGLSPSESPALQFGGSGAMPLAAVHAPTVVSAASPTRKKLVLRIGFAGITLSLVCTIGVLLFMLQQRPDAPRPERLVAENSQPAAAPLPLDLPAGEQVTKQPPQPVVAPEPKPAGDPQVAGRLQLGSEWDGTQTAPNAEGEMSVDSITAKVTQRDRKQFTIIVRSPDGISRRFNGNIDQAGQAQMSRLTSVWPEYEGVLGQTSLESSRMSVNGLKLKLEWTARVKAGERNFTIVLTPKPNIDHETSDVSPDVAATGSQQTDPPMPEPARIPTDETKMTTADEKDPSDGDRADIGSIRGEKLAANEFPSSVKNELKRAVDNFEASCERHRKKLLEGFREQLKVNGQNAAVTEMLKQEQTRFRTRGWLPMSLAMRQYSLEFMRNLSRNPEYDKLTIAFSAAKGQLEREKKAVDASRVAEDYHRRALIYGQWQCESKRFGKEPQFLVELYSNGLGAAKSSRQDDLATIRWETDGSKRLIVYDENNSSTSWAFEEDGLSFVAYDRSDRPEYTGRLVLPAD